MSETHFPFLRLPRELRDKIYFWTLGPTIVLETILPGSLMEIPLRGRTLLKYTARHAYEYPNVEPAWIWKRIHVGPRAGKRSGPDMAFEDGASQYYIALLSAIPPAWPENRLLEKGTLSLLLTCHQM